MQPVPKSSIAMRTPAVLEPPEDVGVAVSAFSRARFSVISNLRHWGRSRIADDALDAITQIALQELSSRNVDVDHQPATEGIDFCRTTQRGTLLPKSNSQSGPMRPSLRRGMKPPP